MTGTPSCLDQRRNQLLGTIADDRRRLRAAATQLHQPLAMVDLGWSIALFVKQHPFVVVGACTTLGAVLPRRFWRWWSFGPLLWRLSGMLRPE